MIILSGLYLREYRLLIIYIFYIMKRIIVFQSESFAFSPAETLASYFY